MKMHPLHLEQNVDALLQITEYEYDLTDLDFVEYCRYRGASNYFGKAGSPGAEYVEDYSKTKDEYLNDERLDFSITGYRYTPRERLLGWKTLCIRRGRLQDTWKIYNAHVINVLLVGILPAGSKFIPIVDGMPQDGFLFEM